MNKRVAKPSVKSPRYTAAKANAGQHWSTAAKHLFRWGSTTANYIRFQWAFRHPRNWRRYTPVTRQEQFRNKWEKHFEEEAQRWYELWLADLERRRTPSPLNTPTPTPTQEQAA